MLRSFKCVEIYLTDQTPGLEILSKYLDQSELMYDLSLALIGPGTNFRKGLQTWGLICQRNFNTFEASKHPIYKKMSDLYRFLKMPPT